MEIGCGKGQFGNTFAHQNPDKNILCVERNRNVLIMAIDKARELGLDNIMFLCGTAEYLPSYIPNNSIEEIYLNFSCPFPKKSHEAHRLTNPRFLEIYKPMLKNGGVICQKTDNMHFFEYSIESFSKCGFKLSNISLDLHKSGFEGISKRNMNRSFRHKVSPFTDWKQGYNKTQYIIKCLTENNSVRSACRKIKITNFYTLSDFEKVR